MQKNVFYLIFSLLFVLTSCSNDDDNTGGEPPIPTNLKSLLSIESNGITVKEGNSFIINFNLTKPFSKDLILEGKFTNTLANYANENDIKKEFSYSSDLGETWQKESNKLQVKFPAGKRNLKVQIETDDDKDPELMIEEINLSFISKTSDLEIGNNELTIKLAVEDNDDPKDTEQSVLMEFTFDDNNNYTISAITNNPIIGDKSIIKEVIDGKYKETLDDIKYVNTLLPASNQIKRFQLIFENSGLGGYVFNDETTRTNNINNWTMGLNLQFAYFGSPSQDSPTPSQIKYNENGVHGYILAHETGHIMTLARKTQFDATIFEENDCKNFFTQEGCSVSDAYLNKFNTGFYIPTAPKYEDPQFVTRYAESNIVEDIAEVIATYVTQGNLPTLNNKSSGALHKVYQIFEYNELKDFREKFRKSIKVGFGNGDGPVQKTGVPENTVIFNKFDGILVPCNKAKESIKKD